MIHKDYQPSNVADLVHCLNIWLLQEDDRMRQAEAIKTEIERLIEACEEALGEVAPVAVPSELD